jgi:hypothetical protein
MKCLRSLFGIVSVCTSSFIVSQPAFSIVHNDGGESSVNALAWGIQLPKPGRSVVRPLVESSSLSSFKSSNQLSIDSLLNSPTLSSADLSLFSAISQNKVSRLHPSFLSLQKHLKNFIEINSKAIGVSSASLNFDNQSFFSDGKNTLVKFKLFYKNAELLGARLFLRFHGSTLTSIAQESFGFFESSEALQGMDFKLQKSDILNFAQTNKLAGVDAKIKMEPRRIIFPSVISANDVKAYSFKPAWIFQSESVDGKGFQFIVAESQTSAVGITQGLRVLEWGEQLWNFEGKMQAVVNSRTIDGPQKSVSLPFVEGKLSQGWFGRLKKVADELGLIRYLGNQELTVSLNSRVVGVVNAAGTSAVGSTSGNLIFDPALPKDSQGEITAEGLKVPATLAETTTFYHANVAQQWAKEFITPAWFKEKISATVNISQVCNAFYNGTINFFVAGRKQRSNGEIIECNNTGEIADVVYHEWGHGLDDNTGGIEDSAYSEAIGDTVSALITNSSLVGPGFMKDGRPVRDLEPNYTYPPSEDLASNPHKEGLVIGSTWFDVFENLKKKHGEVKGASLAKEWFLKSLYTTSQYTDVYEALLALDKKADQLRGENYCLLNSVFSEHGLAQKDTKECEN